MNITEIGGERELIARLARQPRREDVIVGIGDDCAAVAVSGDDDRVLLYSTDMLVESIHFSRRYFSPQQIGVKAMESNVSDIAACGGRPRQALLSLALPASVDIAFVDSFFAGLYEVAERYSFDIVGGDLTRSPRGDLFVVNVAIVGETDRGSLRLRSAAQVGDLIAVSGPLGGSAAGLRLLRDGVAAHDGVKRYHTNPRCSLDVLDDVLPLARAMADVSDGLAADVRNICLSSSVGARLWRQQIPLCGGVREAAATVGDDPFDYALFGGEDFKLVYTLSPEDRDRVVGTIVGEICSSDTGSVLVDDERLTRFGFDHFASS